VVAITNLRVKTMDIFREILMFVFVLMLLGLVLGKMLKDKR